MKQVIVIGAGASGMMAAIAAARAGAKVTILEHSAQSGRKIEISGNGKCNFTNANQDLSYYHTENRTYLAGILSQFPYTKTLAFFEDLGIVLKCKNGYYYPYSGQAKAISQSLRREAEHLGVKFACNIQIKKIKKEHAFYIKTKSSSISKKKHSISHHSSSNEPKEYTYTAQAVILASGSKAAAFTGSDGSGYALARDLGHKVRKPLPALVPLLSLDQEIALLAGLRTEGCVTLVIDGKPYESELGEIQFVKNGLSGIPIFQISSYGARALEEGKKVAVRVNFLTGTGWENPFEALERRKIQFVQKEASIGSFFNGLLHERAVKAICNRMGIKESRNLQALKEEEWKKLLQLLQGMEFTIYKTGSFEQAQVCSGGVSLEQLQEKTLESKIIRNFYFAGEILDVDGACGGYNLQWAWASGYVAGCHAAKDE